MCSFNMLREGICFVRRLKLFSSFSTLSFCTNGWGVREGWMHLRASFPLSFSHFRGLPSVIMPFLCAHYAHWHWCCRREVAHTQVEEVDVSQAQGRGQSRPRPPISCSCFFPLLMEHSRLNKRLLFLFVTCTCMIASWYFVCGCGHGS